VGRVTYRTSRTDTSRVVTRSIQGIVLGTILVWALAVTACGSGSGTHAAAQKIGVHAGARARTRITPVTLAAFAAWQRALTQAVAEHRRIPASTASCAPLVARLRAGAHRRPRATRTSQNRLIACVQPSASPGGLPLGP
jgi:hypothetical protein